jgi:hypothetical protein
MISYVPAFMVLNVTMVGGNKETSIQNLEQCFDFDMRT